MTSGFNRASEINFIRSMTDEKGSPPPKRSDLGARWTKAERSEINALAKQKGVKPTQIIRLAVREYLDDNLKKKD